MEDKLSEKLQRDLDLLNQEIRIFIAENSFYLHFENKSWSSGEAGQKLLTMTSAAINLGYIIHSLKRYGL